ncbi:MAG TPA: c-type cytochrome [Stellaceae bacterium]|jgi:cytochrome c2|nr:c-type cytochrome [Stellaceae bacterium]
MWSARHKRVVLGAALVVVSLAGAGGAELVSLQRDKLAVAIALTGGDPDRAPLLITKFGCGGCHQVPGVPGADGKVAPPLSGLLDRVYIGGTARNTPENLVAWIVKPQDFSPHSAMPETGISAAEARDVAAFLYAH